jgi:pimeloyl-ACP methyl ester carboxylesterase
MTAMLRPRIVAALAVMLAGAPALAQTSPYADRFLMANGLRLHYLEWGDPAKPAMILIHGIARHAHTFDHIAPQFARDHHVLALDMRGHGDSAWSPEGAYLVQDHVKDLEALVAALRLRRVTLLGNSTGGRVVQVFAGLHPDLVERLVVEDVGPERPQNIADAFARRVAQEADGWASEEELVRQLAAANRRTPEPLLRTYAHFGLKPRADGRLVWKRDANLVKGFIETELWDSVSKIKAPALYVIGGGSRIVPPETQQRLKDTLPNCRIVVMPGLGHYPSEEDTEGFLTIVGEFLKR